MDHRPHVLPGTSKERKKELHHVVLVGLIETPTAYITHTLNLTNQPTNEPTKLTHFIDTLFLSHAPFYISLFGVC